MLGLDFSSPTDARTFWGKLPLDIQSKYDVADKSLVLREGAKLTSKQVDTVRSLKQESDGAVSSLHVKLGECGGSALRASLPPPRLPPLTRSPPTQARRQQRRRRPGAMGVELAR